MKHLAALTLAFLIAGCSIRHEPAIHKRSPQPLGGAHGHYATPPALYDAEFFSYFVTWDWYGPARHDTVRGSYTSYPLFFDSIGKPTPPMGVSVSLNGVWLADSIVQGQSGQDSRLDLHYPQPVTWAVRGDGFPTFSHTIATQQPLSITSPRSNDSVEIDRPLEIIYSAPGADSLMIHLTYWASGNYLRDTSHVADKVATGAYYWTANTGHYTIPAYRVDTLHFKNFKAKGLLVHLFWDHGDTTHVDGKIFGFVAEVATSRTYGIKH